LAHLGPVSKTPGLQDEMLPQLMRFKKILDDGVIETPTFSLQTRRATTAPITRPLVSMLVMLSQWVF
jgi:hypothetical protein